MATVLDELSSLVTQMDEHDQLRVLEFARLLANPPIFPHTPLPPGSSPKALLDIRVDPETADAMEAAHQDCERIFEDE